jgi:hypothetical protein
MRSVFLPWMELFLSLVGAASTAARLSWGMCWYPRCSGAIRWYVSTGEAGLSRLVTPCWLLWLLQECLAPASGCLPL